LKPLSFIILAVAALAFGGCAEEQEAGGAGGFQRPPTPIEAGTVTSSLVADKFVTVGTIEAHEAIVVTSEIDGIVTALPFPEGGYMEKGDVIARLQDRQLRAEASRARAIKTQMHASWERVQSIIDQGAGAAQDLDDAVANLAVAEADLALAEARLAKTEITAPFSGFAGKREVSLGTFLRAGQEITDLAQIDRLRVAFALPERLLATIKVGARVSIVTTAYPDHELTGEVAVISPQLNPQTRNVSVVALLENPGKLLKPGMSATVTAILQERGSALTIPSAAVFVQSGQTYVFVISADSLVSRTPVTLGTRLADRVEVTEGLISEQQVVRAGHQKLYEGAKVAPVAAAGEAQ
jgi:membrane fusion protein (multidrug efflux system)